MIFGGPCIWQQCEEATEHMFINMTSLARTAVLSNLTIESFFEYRKGICGESTDDFEFIFYLLCFGKPILEGCTSVPDDDKPIRNAMKIK